MSEPRKFVLEFPPFYKPRLRDHPMYSQWAMMLTRCRNRNYPDYMDWGGRGITVCKRWEFGEDGLSGFQCFYTDMGNKPTEAHTLDRVDNNGGYCKENCRWATGSQQANNRRSNRRLTYQGETLSMMDMAAKHGMNYYVLRNRVSRGWPTDLAMTIPLGHGYHPRKFAVGSQLPQAALTEPEVAEIRDRYTQGGIKMLELAKHYQVSVGTICLLVNRKTWKHVK